MGLITKRVDVNITGANLRYYENKGFEIPRYKNANDELKVKRGTFINISVFDLYEGSHQRIECKCDKCNKDLSPMKWHKYLEVMRNNNGTYCNYCYQILFGAEKIRKANLARGISFYQWCINNNFQDILNRWDYELNDFGPEDVGYATNKYKAYIKCEKGLHKSELKSISAFTVNRGSMNCIICNSVGIVYPKSINVWSNKNELTPFDYDMGSSKIKLWWKCDNNIHTDYFRNIGNSKIRDFRCPKCSEEKNESFLQEKVRLYLELIKTYFEKNNYYIEIKRELDFGTLKCINHNTKRRLPYDNEITSNDFNLIIEVNGEQHSEITPFHMSNAKKHNTTPEKELEYIQWKDEYKKQYALDNGYHYLAIPYWEDDENETYKTSIDNILEFIHKNIQQEN